MGQCIPQLWMLLVYQVGGIQIRVCRRHCSGNAESGPAYIEDLGLYNQTHGKEIQDTSWTSTSICYSSRKVKNREDLFKFLKKLQKNKEAGFRQDTNLIQHFVYHPNYGGTFIQEYSRSSLLCVIMKRSFKSFFNLGDAIRQFAFDHSNWEGGPANAMVTFH